MSSDGPPGAAPRRLHRAGILVLAVDALREAALPMVVFAGVAVAGGGLDADSAMRALALAVFGGLAAAIAGAVTWSTTTWWLGATTIRMRTGLLSTRIVDIPLSRVQAIDTVRGPIQRLFAVQGVHVQTAGGGKEGEIVLVALDVRDLEELRAAVGTRRPEAVAEEQPGAARRLGRGALLVAALTSGQIGVLVPVLAAVPQLIDQLAGGDLEDAGRAGARLVPDAAGECALAVPRWQAVRVGGGAIGRRFGLSGVHVSVRSDEG